MFNRGQGTPMTAVSRGRACKVIAQNTVTQAYPDYFNRGIVFDFFLVLPYERSSGYPRAGLSRFDFRAVLPKSCKTVSSLRGFVLAEEEHAKSCRCCGSGHVDRSARTYSQRCAREGAPVESVLSANIRIGRGDRLMPGAAGLRAPLSRRLLPEPRCVSSFDR